MGGLPNLKAAICLASPLKPSFFSLARSAAADQSPAAARAGVRGGLDRYGLVLWLVLALVLGPMLGQMHRVVHTTGLHAVQASIAGLANADGCKAASADCTQHPWVHALFGGHGPAECQLLDQLNHSYAGPPAVASFEPVAPEGALPLLYAQAAPRPVPAAFFDARAPPAHRLRKI